MKNYKNIELIRTPRTLGIFLIQYMALVPLGTALIIFIEAVFAFIIKSMHLSDLIILSVFIFSLLIIGVLMLYLPQQYINKIIYDKEQKLLNIIKKTEIINKIDLQSAKLFIAQTIKTIPGIKFKLILAKDNDNSLTLIEDDPHPFFGTRHWESFSVKLSGLTDIPLQKERWYEDYNGKLLLISPKESVKNKKYGLLILSVPFTVAFLGASAYVIISATKTFILFGLITVLINICLSFLYVFIYRNKLGNWTINNLTLIFYVLTLLVPYSFLYLFFVFLLNGFQY